MKVKFLKSFEKDLAKVLDPVQKKRIKKVILELESCYSLKEISNSKRMKGYSDVYRIRLGDYRIGLYVVDEEIHLCRYLKRNDIYKVFP